MRCCNIKNGCPWEGTLETLKDHVAECVYAFVLCPNTCYTEASYKDEETLPPRSKILKKNLEHHLTNKCVERQYKCQDCGKEGTYRVITGRHQDICEKKIVICPSKGCGLQLEQGQVKTHLKEFCNYAKVFCKYASIGCEMTMMRKYIGEHEEDYKLHFPIAVDKISELVNGFQGNSQSKHSKVTFKLSNYSIKTKLRKHDFRPFYTSPCGYKLCFFLYPIGCGEGSKSHLSVFLKVLHGPFDDQLVWPFKCNFTVELLNQLTDSNHCSHTITYDGGNIHGRPGGDGWGIQTYLELSKLAYNSSKNTHYLKDDTLYFRVTAKVLCSSKPWLVHSHE